MRLKRPILIIILSVIFVISLITGIFVYNLMYNLPSNDNCEEYHFYDREIFIDGNYQWESTSIGYNWCKGSGTPTNPYIIECLILKGNSTSKCITIKNSNVYFIIKNCIISNGYQGVYLLNVSNGKLFNNSIVDNNYGIYLSGYHSGIVQNNFIRNRLGVFSSGSDNCIIYDNTFLNNEDGMFLRGSDLNEIEKNLFYNNSESAITFYDFCDNNQIINNQVNLSNIGISLHASDHNTISGNAIFLCEIGIKNSACLDNSFTLNKLFNCGLVFHYFYDHPEYYRTHIVAKSNLINNKPLYFYYDRVSLDATDFFNAGQIILINCNDSIISDVDASEGTDGIYLTHCENILLENCTSDSNTRSGINVQYCNNVNISHDFLRNNTWNGIQAYRCDNLEIHSNTLESNYKSGIDLSYSHFIMVNDNEINSNYNGITFTKASWSTDYDLLVISHNEFGFNVNSGILLEYCDNETLYSNLIHDNYYGIYFKGCKFNLVSQNDINYNQYGILLNNYSNNNTIFQNDFITNSIHYQFDNTSTGNIFLENNFL